MNNQTHPTVNLNPPASASASAHPLAARLAGLSTSLARLGSRHRALILLLVLLLVAVISFGMLFPRRVVPAGASADQFSAERALAHLPVIAREAHPSGSPAQARVRDYLLEQLTALGLEVQVQRAYGVENVVARLGGTDPTGAILLQAHYDSFDGPGAADNGAGTAALLEIMRALASAPAPRDDIIALFDDGEELPDEFTGTKAFISKHPWMADVRVAIGMDTAVRGFICTDDTGSENGWMVQALARAYTGGAWTSLCGGGNYDTQPFRKADVRVLELEDNYPFHEQHTPADVAEIVNPGSLQQLGEQALAVTRELSSLDLGNTRGEQQTYMYVPLIGLAHYPERWALPLAILAALLLFTALGLVLWRKLASWRGLGVALLALLVTAGVAFLVVNLVWKAAPGWLHWETRRWHDWPEVIPPHGWLILVLTDLFVLALMVFVYRLARRWSEGVNFSLLGLFIFLLLAVALALSTPRAAILFTWPVLVGAVAWLAVGILLRKRSPSSQPYSWVVELGALLAAIPCVIYLLPMLPAIFMSDGTLSTAIMSAIFPIMLGILLPAVDGLFVRNNQP